MKIDTPSTLRLQFLLIFNTNQLIIIDYIDNDFHWLIPPGNYNHGHKLKLLGITFHEDPCNLHVDSLLSRAASRLYILRVCKYYGYPKDQLSKLFDSLIMSLFLYGLEVWGSAYQGKYLDRIDTFFRRAYRFGYTNKITLISDVIKNRDSDLFNRITSDTGHVLYDLLPPKRNRALRKRGHDFILPKVKTERFKRAFVNRCLFKFIS